MMMGSIKSCSKLHLVLRVDNGLDWIMLCACFLKVVGSLDCTILVEICLAKVLFSLTICLLSFGLFVFFSVGLALGSEHRTMKWFDLGPNSVNTSLENLKRGIPHVCHQAQKFPTKVDRYYEAFGTAFWHLDTGFGLMFCNF